MAAEESRYEYRWSVPAGGSPADRSSWKLEGGPRELGDRAGRFREAVSEAEEALQRSPNDPELLHRLISYLGRLRRYDEALPYFTQLEASNEERAADVPIEHLQPWADRCLLTFESVETRG